MYLSDLADSNELFPESKRERSLVMQWLMFQMGGVGPMLGQANVFHRYAPEKIPYAIDRYQNESRRLFEVLDSRLQKVDYLAGSYSIADIATWPWARIYEWAGVDISGLSALEDWLSRISERPAVERGLKILAEDPTTKDPDTQVTAARSMLS